MENTKADKALAGLTDVPVSGKPTRWTPNKAIAMPIPAKLDHSFLLVKPKTAKTNKNVIPISAIVESITDL